MNIPIQLKTRLSDTLSRYLSYGLLLGLLTSSMACAQPPVGNSTAGGTTDDPFSEPIAATEGAISVKFVEFATIPGPAGEAPRMMAMTDEPGTGRLFVSDMTGPLYRVSYDGRTVTPYVDVNGERWGVDVMSMGAERGFQSLAFHPQFSQAGTPGFGKFYTLVDTANTDATADFRPLGGNHTHDSVLLEWTANDPSAAAYDGAAPRELIRWEQPFPNHNCGHIAFNPTVAAGDPDFGLLYVGFADGGSGGDPMGQAQNLAVAFGKIFRIDPLGNNSANGKYGIPTSNPFAGDNNDSTLGEIYAYGVRNPQRLFWDRETGNMFMSDIGQNIVEEISPVTAGANLGWNAWEGSFRFVSRDEVSLDDPRGDVEMTYPIVEYGQLDPLLQRSSAAIGGVVYREDAIEQLSGLLLFGDNPTGEIFYVSADNLPDGGQAPIRRVLLNDNGTSKTLLQVIQEKNAAQGRNPVNRADLRFGEGADGRVFLLNKGDGTVRLLVPDAAQ